MTQQEAIDKLQPILYLVKLKKGLSFFLDKVFNFMEQNPNENLPPKITKLINIIIRYAK